MTSKLLESDGNWTREFAGRVLTMLGEILRNQNSMRIYLEDAFHVPGQFRRDNDSEEEPEFETEWEDDE